METAVRRLRGRLGEQDGFTLVELIVVVAILGIVIGGLTQLFTSGTNTEIDQTNRVQAQQQARVALDKMRQEIHCANEAIPNPTAFNTDGSNPLINSDGTWQAAQSVTITLGDYCPTYSSSVASVTWCTTGSGASYTLWRYTHSADLTSGTTGTYAAACAGTGTAWAKNITNGGGVTGGNIFTGFSASTLPSMQPPAVQVNSVNSCAPSCSNSLYGYIVDPVTAQGEQPGIEAYVSLYQATIGSTTLNWSNSCPPYAASGDTVTSFKIYGRTPGSETFLASVSEPTPCAATTWTDTDAACASPSPCTDTPVSGDLGTLGVKLPIEYTGGGKKAFAQLTDNITLRNLPR